MNTDLRPGEVEEYLRKKNFAYKTRGEEALLERCPFCGKKKFSMNLSTGQFQCFSQNTCGRSGNLITLKKHFGDLTPLPLPKYDSDLVIQRTWREAVEYWKAKLFETPRALQYWIDRGILKETIEKHNIGFWQPGLLKHLREKSFSDSNLIKSGLIRKKNGGLYECYRDVFVIPVYMSGFIVSFRFRVPPWRKSETKVFTLRGTGSHLFNLDAIQGNTEEIVIAEGEPDALILDQAGIPAVGIPGAGTFKEEWAKHFDHIDTIFVALDPDRAGRKGFQRISRMLGRDVFRIDLPTGKDVNDFFLSFPTREQAHDEFQRLMDNATRYSGGVVKEQSIDHLIPEKGFIREYIDYASEMTDAPIRFHLMGAFHTISSLLRNKLKIEFGAYTLKPNIYSVCLAKSSQFRKSTVLNISKKILQQFEENEPEEESEKKKKSAKIIYPNEFSRESLYPIIQDQPTGTFFINEIKGFLSMLCRFYNEGLKEFFTDIYDGGNIRRTLKKSDYYIKNPCVSIFSASTVEWFVKSLSNDDLAGGFLYRFLYLPARIQERYIPFPPLEDKAKTQKIVETANSINSLPSGLVILGEEAEKHYKKWATKFHRKQTEKHFEPFIERYSQYALKLAILYDVQNGTVDYDSEKQIYTLPLESLKYGTSTIEFFFQETQRLFREEVSFSKSERIQLSIMKILRQAGNRGLSRSDVYKKTRNLGKKERQEALDFLLETGEISYEEIKTRGRFSLKYYIA